MYMSCPFNLIVLGRCLSLKKKKKKKKIDVCRTLIIFSWSLSRLIEKTNNHLISIRLF
jgi:hypothetical protein